MSRKAVISKRMANIRSPEVQAKIYKTEYQDAYKSHQWQAPRKSMRPTVIRGVSTLSYSTDMVSCTHQAFVPHKPNGKPRSYKPKNAEFTKPDIKMNSSTTYSIEFHEKGGNLRPPAFKPNDMKHAVAMPFNAKTVYQAHFIEFNREELDACKVETRPHADNLGKEEKPPFSAQSTAQDSFRPPGNVVPASSLKPEENSHIDHSKPFETETTHRAEFTAKTMPAREVAPFTKELSSKRTPPAMNKLKAAREPFDGLTVFRRDFVNHKMSYIQQSYKPKQKYRRNPTKFDGRTTHRMAYQPIPVGDRKARPPWADRGKTVVVSKAQRAKLDLVTSYQEAFKDPDRIIPKEKCRGVSYKVEHAPYGLGACGDKRTPMEGKTQYRLSYVPWGKEKRAESYKICKTYEPPTAPFFGTSTSSAHYKGTPAPPAKSCRPSIRPRSSPGTMSNCTTYRATFGRRAASCPPPPETSRATTPPVSAPPTDPINNKQV